MSLTTIEKQSSQMQKSRGLRTIQREENKVAPTTCLIDQSLKYPLLEGSKLFLLEARNGLEKRYLIQQIKLALPEPEINLPINMVVLSADEQQSADVISTLAEKLKLYPETRVVPVRAAWQLPDHIFGQNSKKRHLLFGDPRAPGSVRAWFILKRDPQRAQCLIGESASVESLKQRFSAQDITGDVPRDAVFAAYVMRQAGLTLNILERKLQGQRYKAPRFVAASLIASPAFRTAMNKLAISQQKQETELYQEARKYLKELVARPSARFIDLKASIDRFMLSQGYDEEVVFDESQIPQLRKTLQEHPTLLLFTHKTYLDGVTATDLAYKHDLPMLHVFGGINLDFFGLGFVLRRAGTIFLRRSFENNPVYKIVLRHYISYLLEKRFPMTWAFEGTRSRLGKLMPPRYGLLKSVLDSAHLNDIENVHIIPVVTSFDLIRDVEEYALEQTGRVKKPESFTWFLGYMKSLRQPMGKVYVDLGEPVVIKQAPRPSDRMGLAKIAFEIAVQANRATPLTLTSLLCFSLLGIAPRGMTASELRAVMQFIVTWADERRIRLSSDLTDQNLNEIENVINALVNSNLLVRYDQGTTTVYAIEPDKHPLASYYRNSIIHHFLDKAIIELAIYKARDHGGPQIADVFWLETERLRELFKFEFFYPAKEEYRRNLETELTRSDPDWQEKLASGGLALRSLANSFQPLVCHAVFLPFVEAYTIVLDILTRLEPGQAINRKDCVKLALKEGRQAYLMKRITSEASISKILFENGYKMAASQKITSGNSADIIENRKELQREFRALSRRMAKARLDVSRLADRVFD